MLDYTKIPVLYMIDHMRAYMEKGHPPGSFLTALLSNDLMEACRRADDANRLSLGLWAAWLYNEAPAVSFGSPTRVNNWIAAHREETNDAS